MCTGTYLVTGNSKDTASKELLGQGDDIKVKESNLPFIPSNGWIVFQSTLFEGLIHLLEQFLIPLDVNMPMLHGMRDVTSLDEMLNLEK